MRRPLVNITVSGADTAAILERLTQMANAQQEQIDQLAASLSTVGDQLTAGVSGIREDIAALQAAVDAGQPVDLTDLQASVERVAAVAQAVSELDAEHPQLPPVEGETPVDEQV